VSVKLVACPAPVHNNRLRAGTREIKAPGELDAARKASNA
jgi:hypothetical protein